MRQYGPYLICFICLLMTLNHFYFPDETLSPISANDQGDSCLIEANQYAYYHFDCGMYPECIVDFNWSFSSVPAVDIDVRFFDSDEDYWDWKYKNGGFVYRVLAHNSSGSGTHSDRGTDFYLIFQNIDENGHQTEISTYLNAICYGTNFSINASYKLQSVPSTPSNIQYEVDDNQVTLSWEPSNFNGTIFCPSNRSVLHLLQ